MSEHNDAHKDLVKRLRDCNPCKEAADTIEHLSKRCEAYAAYTGQVKARLAETERLTASAPVDGDFRWKIAREKIIEALRPFIGWDKHDDKKRQASDAIIVAISGLALLPARTPGRPNQEADMRALGASEVACYHWPEDTELHRACREAYCRGAADCRPASPPADDVVERIAKHLCAKEARKKFPGDLENVLRWERDCWQWFMPEASALARDCNLLPASALDDKGTRS